MQINDIRSNLFSDPLLPIFVSIWRQSVKLLRPGIVPSIEKLIALKQKLSIHWWGRSPMCIHRRSNKPFYKVRRCSDHVES
jgi:hypothetical protein